MTTIEDLISLLATSPSISVNPWDKNIVDSFNLQLLQGKGFTEKQRALALKLVKKHNNQLTATLCADVNPIIDAQLFRLPIRNTIAVKKISVTEKNNIKFFKVEFPYNEEYISRFRKEKDDLSGTVLWDKDARAWLFSVCEANLKFLISFASSENFQVDDEFSVYKSQVDVIIADIETTIPILALENEIPKIQNKPICCPELQTTDMLHAVFEARQRGISVWDDSISKFLDNEELVFQFLKSDPGEKFHINASLTPINDLLPIFSLLDTVLFVIPGGNEVEKTKQVYQFLKHCNVADEQISVLFRLSSDADTGFNDFVRTHNINSKLSDKTKAVFVSTRLPKTILKSDIKFGGIICLGMSGVHYSIRNFVENHENLIYYNEKTSFKDLNPWLTYNNL